MSDSYSIKDMFDNHTPYTLSSIQTFHRYKESTMSLIFHPRSPSMFELSTLHDKVHRWCGDGIYMVLYVNNDNTRMSPRIKASVKLFRDCDSGWMMVDIIPDQGEPSGVTWDRPPADKITFDLALERVDGTEIQRGPMRCNTTVMTRGSMISPAWRIPVSLIEGLDQ